MPFAESDLGISQDEIDKIKAALESDDLEDAVAQAMAEAEQIVDDHCKLWQVPEETRRRHWRVLTLFDLRTRLNSVPDSLAADHEKAMTALREIRDGKQPFEEIEESEETPIPDRIHGTWGSSDKFTT